MLTQSQSLAGELQFQQEELRQTDQQLEESRPAGGSERRGRKEEPGSRAGAPRSRREGEAADADLQVQVRVPREHVARAPDTLEQPAHPLGPALPQRRRQPELPSRPFAEDDPRLGKDLLALISDILSLSKIESGTVVVDVGELRLEDLLDYVNRTFRHVAEARKLEFQIDTAGVRTRSLTTDAKRLQRVIKNLLSNAFKFTDRGRVALRIATVADGWTPGTKTLGQRPDRVVAISVTDPGIGIPADERQIVSRRSSRPTGTEPQVQRPGPRSRHRPRDRPPAGRGDPPHEHPRPGKRVHALRARRSTPPCPTASRAGAVSEARVPDRLRHVGRGRRPLRSRGIPRAPRGPGRSRFDRGIRPGSPHHRERRELRAVAWSTSRTTRGSKPWSRRRRDALALVQSRGRIDAITLDIQLPVIDGWRVLERLKNDLATRHIPVYVITTEEETDRAFPMGALGALQKPVKTREALEEVFAKIQAALSRPERDLLVISPDAATRMHVREAVGEGPIHVAELSQPAEGLGALDAHAFDCVVFDPGRGTVRDFEAVVEVLRQCATRRIPVAFWNPVDGALSEAEKDTPRTSLPGRGARSARSLDRLVDHALLFLHRPIASLAPEPPVPDRETL